MLVLCFKKCYKNEISVIYLSYKDICEKMKKKINITMTPKKVTLNKVIKNCTLKKCAIINNIDRSLKQREITLHI